MIMNVDCGPDCLYTGEYVFDSDVPDSQFLLSGRSRIVEARGRAGAGYSAGYPAG